MSSQRAAAQDQTLLLARGGGMSSRLRDPDVFSNRPDRSKGTAAGFHPHGLMEVACCTVVEMVQSASQRGWHHYTIGYVHLQL
mmetsp:Transcript_52595/g.87311  ORF Transcript_52595/g.87311 Transcript_52595/m.87311 type:complete len:83 (-) Transcript_52595:364-612(-)